MSTKPDIGAADTRILRSARETLHRGRFVPQDPGDDNCMRVAVPETRTRLPRRPGDAAAFGAVLGTLGDRLWVWPEAP